MNHNLTVRTCRMLGGELRYIAGQFIHCHRNDEVRYRSMGSGYEPSKAIERALQHEDYKADRAQ